MNLARSFVSGVCYTSIDFYDLLRRLRVKTQLQIYVQKLSEERSQALVYRQKYSPAYDRYYRKFLFEIEFPRKYPVHEEYRKLRRAYILRRLEQIVKKTSSRASGSGENVSLTRVICPRCGEFGTLQLQSINNRIYAYVMHTGRRCYIGKLRENRELIVSLLSRKQELEQAVI